MPSTGITHTAKSPCVTAGTATGRLKAILALDPVQKTCSKLAIKHFAGSLPAASARYVDEQQNNLVPARGTQSLKALHSFTQLPAKARIADLLQSFASEQKAQDFPGPVAIPNRKNPPCASLGRAQLHHNVFISKADNWPKYFQSNNCQLGLHARSAFIERRHDETETS